MSKSTALKKFKKRTVETFISQAKARKQALAAGAAGAAAGGAGGYAAGKKKGEKKAVLEKKGNIYLEKIASLIKESGIGEMGKALIRSKLVPKARDTMGKKISLKGFTGKAKVKKPSAY